MRLHPLVWLIVIVFSSPMAAALELERAIELAINDDPWLRRSELQQSALMSRAEAADSLPSPSVSLGLLNVPSDSFDLNQEPMTQVKVAVQQMLPRGDSRAIKRTIMQLEAERQPYLRAERELSLVRDLSLTWLEAYEAYQTLSLIKNDRNLFSQLLDVAEAGYASALGRTRQHDLIRAQLELTQLDDRLAQHQQALNKARARLAEWLPDIASDDITHGLSRAPTIPLHKHDKVLQSAHNTVPELVDVVLQHPLITALDQRFASMQKKIELAQQEQRPQWGINAAYAYRDSDMQGRARSDFLSLGVSVDLPIFTRERQQNLVAASILESESVKTDKQVIMRQLLGSLTSELESLSVLQQRQTLYQVSILTQSHEQAETALTAYTNDDGEFSEVVRARIAELNARIAALKIDVELLKVRVKINYLMPSVKASTRVEERQGR